MIVIENINVDEYDFVNTIERIINLYPLKAERDSLDFKASSKWRVMVSLRDIKEGNKQSVIQNHADHIWFIIRDAFRDELLSVLFKDSKFAYIEEE